MKYQKQAHAVYHTRYHIVFATRYRRKILKSGMGSYLIALARAVERRVPDMQIIKVNTDIDHIHILASITPKMAISQAVRLLKCNTARPMMKRFPFLRKVYHDLVDSIWSVGYFVSTVGIDELTIQQYIENQSKEDSGQAQLELG